ncbi:MAG: carbohydrate ABC transporter permease [Anaerolineae bacterium]|nr:MAG: carbohydrate ABC transporter permease [Anaerolineae bacterium]
MERLRGFISNDNVNQRGYMKREVYKVIGMGTLLMIMIGVATIYLSPLVYMGSTALKTEGQLSDPDDPIVPMSPQTYHYVSPEVETFRYTYRHPQTLDYQGQTLTVYEVIQQGRINKYAFLEARDNVSVFIDSENPEAPPIELEIAVEDLDPALVNERLEVNLYNVNYGDVQGKFGLVEELEGNRTLWMDPEEISEPPFELPIAASDAELVRFEQDLILYKVPMDGETRELALLETGRRGAKFIDPENPDAEPLELDVRVRGLDKVWDLDPHPENFTDAMDSINYFKLFGNTLFIAVVSGLGAMVSATLVAYGFTRFNIPYANILFIILLSTIVLPPQVTQIPTYIVYNKFGWIGTFFPLIVPHFFSNAYNVFLLRQYMMGIPLDMDEAARVDGANPFQILWYVIVPAARPALVAVYLFHFLFSWNDFQQPLIYLGGGSENTVLAVGLANFTRIYSSQQNLMMAAGILTMLVPLAVFFFAQRIFMQGVVITGVEK